MPKLKTNKATAKRFKLTKKGRIKRGMASRRHLLTKKSRKRKRRLGKTMGLNKTGIAHIKRLLPYG